MNRPRALVVGGSLGGLFAAALLRRAGWRADIYERATDDLAGRGAGIGTHAELFEVMRRLGVAIDAGIGVTVTERICLDRDGRVTHELALPQTMSSWRRIYRLMRALLPADCYHPGKALRDVRIGADSVHARFDDGTAAAGDLLVGADGIRSTVRRLFAPEVEPRYAGYVAWRGLVDEASFDAASHAAVFGRYAFSLPDGEMMLSYPVPGPGDEVESGRRSYNFVWYRPVDAQRALPGLCTDASGRCHGLAIAPPLIRPELQARLRADARRLLAPQIAAVVERARSPFFQAIFDVESRRVAFERVALVGDAAFVARPHVGMGVTKAALDAHNLVAALEASGGDPLPALVVYQRRGSAFGARVVARARRLGAYLEAQLKPPAARSAAESRQEPEVVMREIGASLADLDELAGYAHPPPPG